MSCLLDTDVFAAIVRKARMVSSRFAQSLITPYLSVVSVTELEILLLRPRTPLRYRQRFFSLLHGITLLDVTEPIAHRAAMIHQGLRSQGQRIGLGDALIAATALEHGLTLAIHGGQPFANIPGLTAIDWSIP